MRDTRDPREEGHGGAAPGPAGGDGPKFGRLLLVLAFALVLIVAITFGSEAYFT